MVRTQNQPCMLPWIVICLMHQGGGKITRKETQRGPRTNQSYTVGLLGPTAGSGPSETLVFRRNLLQPSALGVVAAPPNTPTQRVRPSGSGIQYRPDASVFSCTSSHCFLMNEPFVITHQTHQQMSNLGGPRPDNLNHTVLSPLMNSHE